MPAPPPPVKEPTAADPMELDAAMWTVGEKMRDYIMARFKRDRVATHIDFYGHKEAFRQTYGKEEWEEAFEWIVDDWDLEPYIFDREALRDS